jgi:hypothetical protein
MSDPHDDESETVSLAQAAGFLLEECRMVLPGILTLFGFQLVAVFSAEFPRALGDGEQRLHLGAMALTAIAVGLIMTPASLHRREHKVTALFIRTSSRLLIASMLPLALSICIDFYLIGQAVTDWSGFAFLSALLFFFLAIMWFVLPRAQNLQRLIGGTDRGRRGDS